MPRAIATGLLVLAAAAAMLAGCGGSGRSPRPVSARERACVGAVVCPYERVELIGRRGEGVLRAPEAIAVGRGGRVYVADQFSHSVQVFSATGRFEAEWGSLGSGPGQFGAVGGLAIGPDGDVYLVDASNDRVEKFTGTGDFLRAWGGAGSAVGQFHFGGGRGPDMPPGGGIAVNGSNVYVADTDNNRIERFSLDGSGARVLVGAGRAPGEVSGPRGLDATSTRLYVTDDGSDRVQELDLHGAFIAQSGTLPAVPERLTNPFGVAVHDGFVYVADDNNGRIVKFSRALRYMGSIIGEAAYRFSRFLRAVAVDRAGHVYVADASRDRIDVFDEQGRPVRSWGMPGTAPGQFVAPLDVASGPGGKLLVVETYGPRSPLYLYSARHAYVATWRRGGEAILGRHWFSPSAAAFGRDGTVWVTDRGNGLVRHLSATGALLGVLAERRRGVAAGVSGVSGGFADPAAVAVDASGDLLVADTGHDRIEKFSPGGRLLASWRRAGPRGGAFRAPGAIAAGAGGVAYIADTGNDRVVELTRRGTLVAAWDGRGSGRGRFDQPTGVAVDAAGHVFVSDSARGRILEFSQYGRFLGAWGRQGTSPGALSDPMGIAVDCKGDVLVADTGNNRVEVFTRAAAPGRCLS